MDCETTRELLSEYYDGVLESETAANFEAHLRDCPACADDFADYVKLFDEIRALPQPEAPSGLHKRLMEAAIPPKNVRLINKRAQSGGLWKRYAYAAGGVAACFIIFSLLVTGIADIYDAARKPVIQAGLDNGILTGGVIDEPESLKIAAMPAPDVVSYSLDSGSADAAVAITLAEPGDTSQMLAAGYYVQNYDISITVDDFDTAVQFINGLPGYSVNTHLNNYGDSRVGMYYRRAAVSEYNQVKTALHTLGEVTNENENVIKQSDQISDLEARLAAKDVESSRLFSLLEQSRTMEVLVAVEGRLGSVDSQRDDIRGRLNGMYDQATNPYISVTITERPPEPAYLPDKTFSQRLNETFVSSVNSFILFCEDTAIFITSALVPLLAIGVVALLVSVFWRGRRKARNNIIMLLALVVALGACGSAPERSAASQAMPEASRGGASDLYGRNDIMYDSEADYQRDESAPMAAAAEAPDEAPSYTQAASGIVGDGMTGEKILKTGNVSLETDDFDSVVDELRFAAVNSGGFVENANIYDVSYNYYNHTANRSRECSMTLRVPREQFDSVMALVSGIGKLISSDQYSEDVTAQYYDTARRLETKKVEEERVLEMISQATKIDDLLALEERLGQIRTDIELYQTQLLNIDRMAAYSTINVTLTEVLTEEYIIVSDDLGGRLQLAFTRGVNGTVIFLQNALLFIAEIFIPLLFIAFLAIVGLVIFKRKKARTQA
jgi:hypothetical protein